MATDSPVPARIDVLDSVRGVAVMGILLMNIASFAMPNPAYYNPAAYGGDTGGDLAFWIGNFVLVDGKMRGLFSFLFGASMLLVIERCELRGQSSAAVHYRRMAVLLLFGLAHLYLIWWGDILAHYAIVGAIAFAFRHMPIRRLVVVGSVLVVVELLLVGLVALSVVGMAQAVQSGTATPEVAAGWDQMRQGFEIVGRDWLAENLATYRGDYAGILAARWEEHRFSPLNLLVFAGPETLAYMLFGMAALRSGLLTGAWPRARLLRWLAPFALCAAGYALLAWWQVRAGFDVRVIVLATLVGGTLLRPLMIVGWAAIIVLLARGHGAVAQRFAAAGRMAFSNYLGSSIVCTTLFYGYGFGLYGTLGRAELGLVVLAIWAAMLLWSKPWLDRFRYGPLEWLWRSASRGSLQPMRGAALA